MLTVKRAASLLYAHFLGVVVAGILLFALSFLLSNKYGMIFFMLLSTLMYFAIVYGAAWELGHRDRRKNSPIIPHVMNGFTLGILASIPGLIIFILAALSKINVLPLFIQTSGGPLYYADILFRIWYVMAVPLFSYMDKLGMGIGFLVVLELPLFAGIGYIAGMKDYDFVGSLRTKFVYEKKKK